MSTQKIFFSYSRADSAFALKLAKDLRDAGAAIWIDQLDIPAGNHWDSAVEKALNTAAYVLVILSPSSTASTNVMDEVSFALESGKKIIPVLLEDCLAPFRLRRLQRIDFTTDYTSGFNQLVLSLSLAIPELPRSEEVASMMESAPVSSPAHPKKEASDTQERENLLWEEACRLNTIASYKYYLNESLSGEYKTEARLLIKQLEVEQKEDELEALLWQQAKTENSRNLYQHYLQEYPQGNYKTLALAAVADIDKAEKDEQNRLKEIEKQQEKERALKAKQEKERQQQIERENAQREKEEKERVRQEEREKAQKEKEEREKQRQIEREKEQKEKAERDKQKQIEREKAQKEKEERERIRREEKAKSLAESGLTPEEAAQQEGAGKKRLILIGAGVLVLALGIWGLTKVGGGGGSGNDELDAWTTALSKNDSTSYASYKAEFPDGQYLALAQQKLDSLNVVNQNKRQSVQTVTEVVTEAPTQVNEDTIRDVQTPATPTTPTTKTTTPSKPASQTPAKTPVQQPKKTTTPPVTPAQPKPKPAEPATKSDHKLALGQQHNGGIVIFINSTGEHGFVAALKEEGKYSWTAAQRRCGAYKSGGFSDWRLPTRDELGVMYDNRKHLGNYTKGIYWSGTEDGKDIAWGVNFINGSPGKFDKGSANSVWAVHPF